jgi:Flp pilus assembly pilin Flp
MSMYRLIRDLHRMSWPSLGEACRRFGNDRKGAAGLEFGLFVPVLALAFVLTIDIAQAVSAKYDTERKMRLAIEGILRYGDDTTKVVAFANGSGNSAFSSSPNPPENASTLTIDPYSVCRSVDGTVLYFTSLQTPTCTNYENWHKITTAGSVTGIFGKTFEFGSTVDIFSE